MSDDRKRYIMVMADGYTFGFSDPVKIKLDVWQRLVGGNVEVTYPFPSVAMVGICWEEARIFASPTNWAATHLHHDSYGYSMVGDFIFAGDTAGGEFTGLDDAQIGLVNQSIVKVGGRPVDSFLLTSTEAAEVADERRASTGS